MDDYAGRAEKYRNKAEETRMVAESMTNPETRVMLFEVAADYLQMAQTLERLAAEKKSG